LFDDPHPLKSDMQFVRHRVISMDPPQKVPPNIAREREQSIAIPRGQIVMPPIVVVHFDGACAPPRGGGVATYGFTAEGGDGIDYEEYGLAVRPWSPSATNNVAEYVGAIRGLEYLRSQRFLGHVVLLGDSQLVIRQMKGEYAVRAAHLKPYHDHLEMLAKGFPEVRPEWIPRSENERADWLSKEALRVAAIEAAPHRPTGRQTLAKTEPTSQGDD
jgi:ribonuclease HI